MKICAKNALHWKTLNSTCEVEHWLYSSSRMRTRSTEFETESRERHVLPKCSKSTRLSNDWPGDYGSSSSIVDGQRSGPTADCHVRFESDDVARRSRENSRAENVLKRTLMVTDSSYATSILALQLDAPWTLRSCRFRNWINAYCHMPSLCTREAGSCLEPFLFWRTNSRSPWNTYACRLILLQSPLVLA